MPHAAWKKCVRHLTPQRLRDTLMEMVDIPSPTGRELDMEIGRASCRERV